MTDEELFDALDGLFAYDRGCASSGIHDEVLRERVIAELKKDSETWPHSQVGPRLMAFVRSHYYVEPYTLEDVHAFVKWLADEMDFDIR